MRTSLVFVGDEVRMFPDLGRHPDGLLEVTPATAVEFRRETGDRGWLFIDNIPFGRLAGIVIDHLDTKPVTLDLSDVVRAVDELTSQAHPGDEVPG